MYCCFAFCQRFGAGIEMSTGEIVHRGLRYELIPVSMLISAVVPFCLLLKEIELLILRPTRHTGALLFHRVVSVSDGKITECFYDTRILRA